MAKYYRIVTIKSEIVDEEGNILKTQVKKRIYDLDGVIDMPPKPHRVVMDQEFFNACYTTNDYRTEYDELYLPKSVRQAYYEEKGIPIC